MSEASRLESFRVGEESLLQGLRSPRLSESVILQPHGLQPPGLAEDEEFEQPRLRRGSPVDRLEQARPPHLTQPVRPRGVGGVVASEGGPGELDREALRPQPQGDLVACEPFLGVDPPVLEPGVARGVEDAGEPGREEQTDSLTLRRMAVDGLTGRAEVGWCPPAHAYAVHAFVVGRHGRVFLSP